MRIRKIVHSRKFWGGAIVGMVAGPWALNKVRQVTGVGLSVPRIGNGS